MPSLTQPLHSTAFQCIAVHAFAVLSYAVLHLCDAVHRTTAIHLAFAVPSGSLLRASQLCRCRAKDREARASIAFAELSGATRRDAFATNHAAWLGFASAVP